jgi:hypothetical protein
MESKKYSSKHEIYYPDSKITPSKGTSVLFEEQSLPSEGQVGAIRRAQFAIRRAQFAIRRAHACYPKGKVCYPKGTCLLSEGHMLAIRRAHACYPKSTCLPSEEHMLAIRRAHACYPKSKIIQIKGKNCQTNHTITYQQGVIIDKTRSNKDSSFKETDEDV